MRSRDNSTPLVELMAVNDLADKLRDIATENQNISLHENSALRRQIVKNAEKKGIQPKLTTKTVSRKQQPTPTLESSSTPVTHHDPKLPTPLLVEQFQPGNLPTPLGMVLWYSPMDHMLALCMTRPGSV